MTKKVLYKHINSTILQAGVHRMPLHGITAKTEIVFGHPERKNCHSEPFAALKGKLRRMGGIY